MNRILAAAACLIAVAVVAEADFTGWHFWQRFARPWEVFIQPSYDMKKSLALTDTNNDGIISLQEIRDDVARFDSNGDGRVTRCEYVRYNVEVLSARLDIINNNYDNLDRNNDNYLTIEDANLFAPLVPFIDINRDNQLSTYEMMKAFRQGDLDAMKKAECEPYYLYRLPPKELRMMKRKCAQRKAM